MREDERARARTMRPEWELSAPRVFEIEPIAAPADVLALRLSGELDVATSAALREQIDAVVPARARALVLDFADVPFIDSSTLRELIRARGLLSDRAGLVVVAAARPAVLRLLELTGTAELFTVVETRAEAFAAAGAAS